MEEAIASGEWREKVDKKSGRTYWQQKGTRVTTWDLSSFLSRPSTPSSEGESVCEDEEKNKITPSQQPPLQREDNNQPNLVTQQAALDDLHSRYMTSSAQEATITASKLASLNGKIFSQQQAHQTAIEEWQTKSQIADLKSQIAILQLEQQQQQFELHQRELLAHPPVPWEQQQQQQQQPTPQLPTTDYSYPDPSEPNNFDDVIRELEGVTTILSDRFCSEQQQQQQQQQLYYF